MSIPDLDSASPGEATREFYRQQGRKQEQERIIALLEELSMCDYRGHDYSGSCYCEEVAIIKGERE